MKGYDKVSWHKNPRYVSEINRPTTRGHKYRIIKEATKINVRSNFFNNRIANNWNALPEEIVNLKSVNTFKSKLDEIYLCNKTFKSQKK